MSMNPTWQHQEQRSPVNGQNKTFNWAPTIIAFVGLNVSVVAALIIIGPETENVLLYIALIQTVAFFLAGMLLGYWTGRAPFLEISGIIVGSFVPNVSKLIQGELPSSEWISLSVGIALGVVFLVGGSLVGAALKRRVVKRREDTRIVNGGPSQIDAAVMHHRESERKTS